MELLYLIQHTTQMQIMTVGDNLSEFKNVMAKIGFINHHRALYSQYIMVNITSTYHKHHRAFAIKQPAVIKIQYNNCNFAAPPTCSFSI